MVLEKVFSASGMEFTCWYLYRYRFFFINHTPRPRPYTIEDGYGRVGFGQIFRNYVRVRSHQCDNMWLGLFCAPVLTCACCPHLLTFPKLLLLNKSGLSTQTDVHVSLAWEKKRDFNRVGLGHKYLNDWQVRLLLCRTRAGLGQKHVARTAL